jgi:hypothetical protein
MTDIRKAVRDRLWLSLSPETAEAAGVSLATLQQFLIGESLSDQQIQKLARHFGIEERAA